MGWSPFQSTFHSGPLRGDAAPASERIIILDWPVLLKESRMAQAGIGSLLPGSWGPRWLDRWRRLILASNIRCPFSLRAVRSTFFDGLNVGPFRMVSSIKAASQAYLTTTRSLWTSLPNDTGPFVFALGSRSFRTPSGSSQRPKSCSLL